MEEEITADARLMRLLTTSREIRLSESLKLCQFSEDFHIKASREYDWIEIIKEEKRLAFRWSLEQQRSDSIELQTKLNAALQDASEILEYPKIAELENFVFMMQGKRKENHFPLRINIFVVLLFMETSMFMISEKRHVRNIRWRKSFEENVTKMTIEKNW